MYNIITLKGELMKKLFILTILLSAKLMSAAHEESSAMLTAAQKEHQSHLGKASESAARMNTLQQAATQNPTPDNIRALNTHIATHNQTVDHCKQCVMGLQNTLKDVNSKGDYVQGDAFRGSVAPSM